MVMQTTLDKVVQDRAAAYDEIYAKWHPKRITVDWFERYARFFLNAEPGETGNINGNEIECALNLLGANDLRGKTILDFCCGTGITSIYFALRGGDVRAFDASAKAIEIARQSAGLSDVKDNLAFEVMDAQDLKYASGTFDAAFCQSALHIIADYPHCAAELARVIKPEGRAIFCEEVLGYNWFLKPVRWWRRRRYRECGGRTLTYEDIHRFGRQFRETRIYHFNLFSQIKTFFGGRASRPWAKAILRPMNSIDEVLIRRVPWIRKYCGKIVVEFVGPIQARRSFFDD